MATRQATVYKHIQETAALSWVIDHHLQSYPIVDVYTEVNGSAVKILPKSVVYNTPNQCTVTFSQARSGVATVI
jgi:hypothetical protein